MFENIREDVKVFNEHHGESIFAKVYYPMFVATILIRLQCFLYTIWFLRPISYLIVRVNDCYLEFGLGQE